MKYLFAATALLLCMACRTHVPVHTVDWPVYGGGKDSRHYASLTEIDTSNVDRLSVAWTYHTGDADKTGTQIQVNGLEDEGVFYGVSPHLKAFALDAATGQERWTFDPSTQGESSLNVCRGVALYKNGNELRLFYSAGAHLFCLDAHTGKPIPSFGQGGSVDLHDDLDRPARERYVASTTPGLIYKDLIIIGTRVDETTPAAPGSIRAYDVHTGARRWIFHTIPWPGEAGYHSWEDSTAWRYAGAANTWAGFSLDEARGVVFAPTGSASYDFYGGNRRGEDLFANCVLALDAATGRRLWHFQTVHHDLWDRDLPTPPVLATLHKDSKPVDAVVQITKSGFIFVLDGTTGAPLYPVTETPVPTQSELAGEQPWPTQPVPTYEPPFTRQQLTIDNLNPLVSDTADLRKRLDSYHNGLFQPPSREGTVIFPGFDGGGEWGGPSYDPATGILYVNGSEMPWVLTMVRVGKGPDPIYGEAARMRSTNLEAGQALYATRCMSCHGPERQGGGNYPSLLHAPKDYTQDRFFQLLRTGRRMMPAFPDLGEGQQKALASFILDDKDLQTRPYTAPPAPPLSGYDSMPFTSTGYNKFLTRDGYPAVSPPWGFLTAIDLERGRVLWKDTLGDDPAFKARGIHTGTENYGGSVVTAGGLIFIAATRDAKFRAFNKRDGRLLWETDLPACGFATPSVYSIDGKEYVVIACGGGKLGTRSGDAYVAYALP
ncbi:outer membrane protein assembly factor BamB family protein [Dinghuibacter silviterrae]|uniref:Quinoprotein glucose dehydrogenase n=1 Tax=Dinghuibacter silviterrae TaxID=1539049 RepID=A0A4V3GLY9_9BACT|nr:PQQ-binding-like beta-propeller repeat protein [Dinghuibacter silviterrae]TDX01363.1 quinoprotein glucose dehydrogenase [Dinghuibacter silviterrae]